MPEHSIGAKWNKLREEIGWGRDIVTLRLFSLVAISAYAHKDPNGARAFLEFYFPEKFLKAKATSSKYNQTKAARWFLAGVLSLEAHTIDEYIGPYINFKEDELIRWSISKEELRESSYSPTG